MLSPDDADDTVQTRAQKITHRVALTAAADLTVARVRPGSHYFGSYILIDGIISCVLQTMRTLDQTTRNFGLQNRIYQKPREPVRLRIAEIYSRTRGKRSVDIIKIDTVRNILS